jgi:purine-binding chemotaxis protein CheW
MTGVHVRVDVAGEQYALPVEHVKEVVETGELAPVPGAPDSVLGLRNLAGDIVPALDLAAMLGIQRQASPARLVIVERDGRPAGLAVNKVLDVGHLAGESHEHESPYLAASVLVGDAMVGVLDLDALLEKLSAAGVR